VLLSEYVPVAASCSVVPFAIDGLAGVTAIDTRIAGVTVSVAGLLVYPYWFPVICVLPAPTPVANPKLETVATVVTVDTQFDGIVTFAVLPSVYVAVNVNCSVVPFAIVAVSGERDIFITAAGSTVSVTAGLVIPFSDAVICDAPNPTAVESPAELIVATLVVPDTQVACVVMFFVLLSEYVPVAVNG
jgi:hypothetical protein